MRVKSLSLTRNPYTWDQDGTPPGEIGGEVVLAGDAGELRIRLAPENVDAILATVAQAVAIQAQLLTGAVTPALVRNGRSEVLAIAPPPAPPGPPKGYHAFLVDREHAGPQPAADAVPAPEGWGQAETSVDDGPVPSLDALAEPAAFAGGQVWRNRAGDLVTIRRVATLATLEHPDDEADRYPVKDTEDRCYTIEGRYYHDGEDDQDLVELVASGTVQSDAVG